MLATTPQAIASASSVDLNLAQSLDEFRRRGWWLLRLGGQDAFEITRRLFQAGPQLDFRFPAQFVAGEGDVGLALFRIVNRQGLENQP